MNCEQVKQRLADYLDHELDRETRAAVESHLSGCPLCQTEAEGLDRTIRSVAGLPSVEPPPGFSQRVMARVRKEAQEPDLWDRLFLPLRIKFPIHASALLLVGVLAVYLYQTGQPPEMEPSKPPPPEAGPVFRQRASPEKERDTALSERKTGVADEVAGKRSTTVDDARSEATMAFSPAERQPTAPEKSVVASAPADRALSDRIADYELVFAPGKSLEGVKLLGKALDDWSEQPAREIVPGRRTLWLALPQIEYDQLKTELASLGKIESETRTAAAEREDAGKAPGRLRIKLTILAPEEPEKAPAVKPQP